MPQFPRRTRAARWAALAVLATAPALPAQAPARTLPVGAVVRVRLAAATALPERAGDETPREVAHGRLVALDSGGMTLGGAGGWRQSFPASSVAALEVRTGRGRCAGAMRRPACGALGLVAGALLGRAAGHALGAADEPTPIFGGIDVLTPSDAERHRRRMRRNGAYLGAAIGGGVGLSVARDRWARVRAWPGLAAGG